MVSKVLIVLVLSATPLAAQEKLVQVYGTHAFLSVATEAYFDSKSGSIKIPSEKISITGFTFERDVEEQYSAFQSEDGYQALAFPGVARRLLLVGTSKFQENSWIQQVMLLLGDGEQTTTILFVFPTAAKETKVPQSIARMMKSSYLDKSSPTNWQKLSFFENRSLGSLLFTVKTKNSLTFSRKGRTSPNSLAVTIGQAKFQGDVLDNRLKILQALFGDLASPDLNFRTGEVNSRRYARVVGQSDGNGWKERIVTIIEARGGYFFIDGYLQNTDEESERLYNDIVAGFEPFQDSVSVE